MWNEVHFTVVIGAITALIGAICFQTFWASQALQIHCIKTNGTRVPYKHHLFPENERKIGQAVEHTIIRHVKKAINCSETSYTVRKPVGPTTEVALGAADRP